MAKAAPTLLNLINHGIRAFLAHVVDHNVGAKSCVHQRVYASKTIASTGNDDSLAVEPNLGRRLDRLSRRRRYYQLLWVERRNVSNKMRWASQV